MKGHRKRSEKRRRRQLGAIERSLLSDLSFGDMLFGYLLSAGSTGRMFKLARQRATERYRRKQAIERLVKLQFIQKHGEKLSITTEGRNVLGRAIDETRNQLKTKKWDKKWRVVAFDIPEEYAGLRNKVRDILKRAGFIKMHQSIWVFPHDSEELTLLIKERSGLSEYIFYGVLEYVEDEQQLKEIFNLNDKKDKK